MHRKQPLKNQSGTKRPSFIAWHVPERDNALWTRLGAAWDHDDGDGFTLQLELMPAQNGRIVLRRNTPKPHADGDQTG